MAALLGKTPVTRQRLGSRLQSGSQVLVQTERMLTETTARRQTRQARLTRSLNAALQQQRQAHLAHPLPTLAARKADLLKLRRYILDHQEAICDAISADYGHRSRHETLLMELMPVISDIQVTLKHLAEWMKPQKRAIDRKIFGLASNRVIPQPLGVVGVIVPWNFPINLSFLPLVAIFAAGNRAMVKMSENSHHLAQLQQVGAALGQRRQRVGQMRLALLLQSGIQRAGQACFARLAAGGGFGQHLFSLNQKRQPGLESAA